MSADIYREMTDKMLLSGSKIIPQLLKMISDRDEAELLMAMPGTPQQLSEKIGKSEVFAEPAKNVATSMPSKRRKPKAAKKQ